jgi:hypothetical protein
MSFVPVSPPRFCVGVDGKCVMRDMVLVLRRYGKATSEHDMSIYEKQ